MEIVASDFLSVASRVYQSVSTSTFLSGLSVGAVGGFFFKHLIDWYLTKYKTRRSENEKRRLLAYEQMLKLIEDFHGNNKLLRYNLSHRNHAEEDEIVQHAIKEGKDPKRALANHVAPASKPEVLMIELSKCLGRIEDDKAELLASDWAKALHNCIATQMALWEVREKKLLVAEWTELWESRESALEQEIKTKKALLKYLRGRLR